MAVSIQRITTKDGEVRGFRTVRRFRDIVSTHMPEPLMHRTVTSTVDPRLPILDSPIKASLCRSCKVEQAYTGGFHAGRCSACCPCDRHADEREALRMKGLWVAR